MPNTPRENLVKQALNAVLGVLVAAFSCATLVPTSAGAQDSSPVVRLKQLAAPHFGVGVGIGVGIVDQPADWQLLTTHFAFATPENCMKPQDIQAHESTFTFDTCDRFVGFASEQQLKIVGHCLVWAKDDRTPAWFFADGDRHASREVLLQRMKTHIFTLAGRYRDRIAMWDVVNEALADSDDQYLRDSGWTRATGEEFIVKAFEYARAADPDALLIYNDYRCDTDGKREKLLRLVRTLKEHHAPVDAIGLQGHYELDSVPYEGLEKLLKTLSRRDSRSSCRSLTSM